MFMTLISIFLIPFRMIFSLRLMNFKDLWIVCFVSWAELIGESKIFSRDLCLCVCLCLSLSPRTQVFGFVKAKVFFFFLLRSLLPVWYCSVLRDSVFFFLFWLLWDAHVGRHRHDCAFFGLFV
jgi:hypothetical protein